MNYFPLIGLFMFDGGDVDSEEQFYQSDDESESEEGSKFLKIKYS